MPGATCNTKKYLWQNVIMTKVPCSGSYTDKSLLDNSALLLWISFFDLLVWHLARPPNVSVTSWRLTSCPVDFFSVTSCLGEFCQCEFITGGLLLVWHPAWLTFVCVTSCPVDIYQCFFKYGGLLSVLLPLWLTSFSLSSSQLDVYFVIVTLCPGGFCQCNFLS